MLAVPPPPSALDQAIRESGQRFEAALRKELGFMAVTVDVARYVELYKAELRAFLADIQKRGCLK